MRNELVALVGDELADAVADADHRSLELNHAQRDAIHVEHDVGPLDVGTIAQRDLLGEGEVVKPVKLPVDVVDVHLRPAGTGPDLGPVAQQLVHILIDEVQRAALVVDGTEELLSGPFGQGSGKVAFSEVAAQFRYFYAAVATAVLPVADVAPTEFPKLLDDPVLGEAFAFGGLHGAGAQVKRGRKVKKVKRQ